MQIKIKRVEDGPACVEVATPDGQVTSSTDVNVGEEVVVTVPDAHSPEDIQVGEVTKTPAESEQAEAEEPGQTAE